MVVYICLFIRQLIGSGMSHLSVLPKLPVPTLSGTLDRFLTALAPLLSPEQFSETIRLTEEFKREQGPLLQEKVLKLSRETDNWATHVWLQTRFLRNRGPLHLTNGTATLDTKATWATHSNKKDTIAKYIIHLAGVALRIRTNKFNWEEQYHLVPLELLRKSVSENHSGGRAVRNLSNVPHRTGSGLTITGTN